MFAMNTCAITLLAHTHAYTHANRLLQLHFMATILARWSVAFLVDCVMTAYSRTRKQTLISSTLFWIFSFLWQWLLMSFLWSCSGTLSVPCGTCCWSFSFRNLLAKTFRRLCWAAYLGSRSVLRVTGQRSALSMQFPAQTPSRCTPEKLGQCPIQPWLLEPLLEDPCQFLACVFLDLMHHGYTSPQRI